MILHVPHAAFCIPDDVRATYVIDDDVLEEELLRLTDAFTDELFVFPGATTDLLVSCFAELGILIESLSCINSHFTTPIGFNG